MTDLNDLIDNIYILEGGRSTLPLNPTAVIIIGSSGAGKTTLVNYIKNETDLVGQGKVKVPKRFITREKREGDDLGENTHLTWDQFILDAENSTIPVHWERDLGGDKKERYGFEAAPETSCLTLYSANNAMVRDGSGLHPADLLDNALIIGVHTPDEERWKRFSTRSNDVVTENVAQASIRKNDHADSIFKDADIVISNRGTEQQAGQALERILKRLIYKI